MTGGLGDGEKLETNATGPDYVRLALTSRVYDLLGETPLQYASGLSERLNCSVHVKREVSGWGLQFSFRFVFFNLP
jgi:threonine dehydratase